MYVPLLGSSPCPWGRFRQQQTRLSAYKTGEPATELPLLGACAMILNLNQFAASVSPEQVGGTPLQPPSSPTRPCLKYTDAATRVSGKAGGCGVPKVACARQHGEGNRHGEKREIRRE